MTLQKQLRFISGLTVLSLFVVIAFSYINLDRLKVQFENAQSESTVEKNLVEIKATALSVARDDPILPETGTRLTEADEKIQDLSKQIMKAFSSGPMRKNMDDISSNWNDYVKGFRGAIRIASDSPNDALQIPDALYSMQLLPMTGRIDALVAANKTKESASGREISASMQRIRWVVIIPLIAAGLIVTVFQWFFNRGLQYSMRQIVESVDHLHRGDLSRRLPCDKQDEIGIMAKTINAFVARFESIVRDAQHSSTITEKMAHEISSSAENVMLNAKNQSERFFSVEESLKRMGSTIQETALHSNSAADVANRARLLVEDGNAAGKLTMSALNRLNFAVHSSATTISELNAEIQRIGQVSNIIRDIADQTNLLALNAAIEAARAGETGRGFAVVADEVRKLAERTSSSTSDIARIVEAIQSSTAKAGSAMEEARREVGLGVEQGGKVEKLLGDIDASVRNVTEMMHQIASATEGQSVAGNEILESVDTLAEITSSSVADIELTRDAMSELAGLAKSLHGKLGAFRLSEV
ncbi:MAG: methyl-accepting chemotaxis protein [Burkholderiales bacterium]